jgi:uncharacterized protein
LVVKAAKQEDKYAQCNLGLSYLRGDGVRENKKQAIKWLKLSAKQGFNRAEMKLKVIIKN